MISSVNMNSDETMEMLKECVEKVQRCSVVATLRQGMEASDGTGRDIVVTTQAVEVAENEVYVNMEDGFVYLYIHEVDGNFFDLKKIRGLWDSMVKHNSDLNLKGEPGDYFLTIDLINPELENSKSYCISIVNPIFAADDDGMIIFVGYAFEQNRFMFDIENISLVDIEYEEEMYKESQEDRLREEFDDEYDEYSDFDEGEVSDDFISNDEFTDFIKQ